MKSRILEAHLMDEAPKIGCGHRLVIALIGRTAVRLFCPFTLSVQKIRMPVYLQIERVAQKPRMSKTALIRCIREKRAYWESLRIDEKDKAYANKISTAKRALAILREI